MAEVYGNLVILVTLVIPVMKGVGNGFYTQLNVSITINAWYFWCYSSYLHGVVRRFLIHQLFKDALISVRRTFDLKGRSDANEYVAFNLICVMSFLIIFGAFFVFTKNGLPSNYRFIESLHGLYPLITIPTAISLSIRRLHDVGRSGAWLLISLTIIGIAWLVFYLALKKGDADENKYGVSPDKPKANKVVLASYFLAFIVYSIVGAIGYQPAALVADQIDGVVFEKSNRELRGASVSDLLGLGQLFGRDECTHELLDGSCFTTGDYDIFHEAKISAPQAWDETEFWCFGSCSDETVVRRVRNKLTQENFLCHEDHIEISGVVNPELSFLVTKILKNIHQDPARCVFASGKKEITQASKTQGNTFSELSIDVYLDSPGGFVSDGIEMSRTFLDYSVTTIVPPDSECASACTLLFLAGRERSLSQNSSLGFHSSYVITDNDLGFSCLDDFASLEAAYGRLVGRELTQFISDRALVCNPFDTYKFNQDAALVIGLSTF